MTIGSRIKQVREERRVSRPQLAKLAGVPYPTLAGIENDDQSGSTRLHAIAKALRVNVEWLESGTGPKEAASQPAPLSVSRHVRLDPSIVRDVAQALQETYAELGLVYSITAEPELFAEFYERAVALGSVESRSNLVWLGTRIRKGEARQGEDSEQSKGVGNQGNGAGKARRHRAKG
jgi:transcriptional regulator with XRE-family HTH domain